MSWIDKATRRGFYQTTASQVFLCLSFPPNITSQLSVAVSAFFTFMLIAANTVVNVSVNNNNNNNNNNQERLKIETLKV